jgi:pimeloyl-ACP methyl ester carboxylesterase
MCPVELPLLTRRSIRRLVAAAAVAVLLVGCTGTSGGGWTYPPVTPAPASGAPAPVASATGSAAPSGGASSAAPSPAASGGPPASPAGSPAARPAGSPGASPSPAGSPAPSHSAAAVIPALAAALPQDPKVVSVKPRPGSSFTCVTLAVPRDHFTAGGPTWNVTFGIKKAAKERRGVFVTITGGPGTSGLDSAEDYTSSFEPALTDYNDIVFLDQRGVGLSQLLGCPVATAAYYQADKDPTDPAQFDGFATDSQTYVAACLAETKVDQADLPYYSTRQAVEDLEAFREYLGVDKLALYGESYGTQYVQTYAAAHPDHVASLFVDGPVDLTVNEAVFFREEVRAFDDSLTATMAACDGSRTCRADAIGTTTAGYDALRKKLLAAPVAVRFPTAKGTFVTRQLTAALLDNAAAGYVYSQYALRFDRDADGKVTVSGTFEGKPAR